VALLTVETLTVEGSETFKRFQLCLCHQNKTFDHPRAMQLVSLALSWTKAVITGMSKPIFFFLGEVIDPAPHSEGLYAQITNNDKRCTRAFVCVDTVCLKLQLTRHSTKLMSHVHSISGACHCLPSAGHRRLDVYWNLCIRFLLDSLAHCIAM